MIDPIKLAQQKTKLDGLVKTAEAADNTVLANKAKEALNNLKIPEKIPTSLEDVGLKIPELPIQPDLELLKKEAMARAQTLRAEAEQMLQQRKEEEINKLKERVESLVPPQLIAAAGLLLVLPIIDPKFLAWLAYQKAKQKIKELKQIASKENLKKSKEAFSFPMKPPARTELGQLSAISEKPKIPEIPTKNSSKEAQCQRLIQLRDVEVSRIATAIKTKEAALKKAQSLQVNSDYLNDPAWKYQQRTAIAADEARLRAESSLKLLNSSIQSFKC